MTSTTTDPAVPAIDDCWNRIGIAGDRTCPELETYVHCRNCPVFAHAAGRFFDRPAPEGYLADWSRRLAAPVPASDAKDLSLLIFRLRDECLALPSRAVVEVTTTRPFHRIPHRSNDTLLGLVNLRGQLHLQVSLHGLLGVNDHATPPTPSPTGGKDDKPRLVVIRGDGETWVFEADQVLGVHRFAKSRLDNVPSTLANPAYSFSRAVIDWQGKSVGLLDDPRVFSALRGLGR